MQWNYRKIRKNSWTSVFYKGRKSWLMLVAVGFLFSFVGAGMVHGFRSMALAELLLYFCWIASRKTR